MINAQPKTVREVDGDYLRWIRSLPCVVPSEHGLCQGPVEAHHIVPVGGAKTGSKTDDRRCVPACNNHHRRYHDIGRAQFERIYLVDFESEICRLNALYRPKPKRVLKKQPQATVKIDCCNCGKWHVLPFSKVTVTKDAIVFRCPTRNLEVSAKMKGAR